MDKAPTSGTGVFLNGKAQVIEMLKFMNNAERKKLLRNIRLRNPQLAEELTAKSLTFSSISALSNHELKLVFQHINPQILGIALKNIEQALQRKILSLAPRDYAESAYSILISPIKNEFKDIQRAQSKIMGVLASLNQRKQLNLN
ncbi:MAG: hypothetical protein ISR65_09875 [Bacteriovoracaceae bacterium]|nr:hypothetical protein [Bacteriovoracaceae bacterium]